MKLLSLALLCLTLSATGIAETTGLCMISASSTSRPLTAQVMLSQENCDKNSGNCMEMSNSNFDLSRWTGISQQTLQSEGSQATAHLTGEAGGLSCSGVIHDGVLSGRFRFNPNEAFEKTMTSMGFDNVTTHNQLTFLVLDITSAWTREIKSLGVTELTTGKLIGLRALHVDAAYIHAMSAAGYPELRASKLTEMKAVGVTPEKAREAKAMGFQPTEQELIQMSIFKIDRPFVDHMRSRGLTDLTLAKLIKVRIFKLED